MLSWQAGRVEIARIVELDHVISREIRLTPRIGHTPGHKQRRELGLESV